MLCSRLFAALLLAWRAAVTGVYLEDRQAVDVARERGVSRAAISKSLAKGLERLRDELDVLGG